MPKAKKLYILLGVLVVLSIAVFAVSHYEQKQEEIRTSDEIVLSIPTDTVTAVSWTNESGSFTFTLDENGTWIYEADTAFPADTDKIEALLEPFSECGAAFVIENVEDPGMYGLDDPVCTIEITAGEETTTVTLGDYSQMDSERYASTGDGNVYLLSHDPLDEFDAVLSDMILHDTVPDLDDATEIVFTGSENCTVTKNEDGKSICADDIYFSGSLPLDTDRVQSYLTALDSLSLTDYVTYNATDDELAAYGLTDPALTVTVTYPVPDESEDADEDATVDETVTVSLGQNAEELADAEESGDYDDVTCYARVGDSGIVYEISGTKYDTLLRAGEDNLRHAEIFTADFAEVTSMEITLDGETYTFTVKTGEDGEEDAEESKSSDSDDEEDEVVWLWNDEEIDISSVESALEAVEASEFTTEKSGDTVELKIRLTLSNEDFPTLTLTFYRKGGENCIAAVDGTVTAVVPRSDVVDLAEAIRTITLGGDE